MLKELEQLGNTLEDANFSDKGSEDDENGDADAKSGAEAFMFVPPLLRTL